MKRITTILLLLAVTLFSTAQKKSLQISDYGRFRSVSAELSEKGNVVAYVYSTPRNNDTLLIRNMVSGRIDTVVNANRPSISDDEKWISYRINPSFKAAEKLREDKKPVTWKAGLMNLSTGAKTEITDASSAAFSKGSRWYAVQKNKADQSVKTNGRDLLLTDLNSGMVQRIGSVSDYSFNKSGSFLAYTIEAPDSAGNGILIMNLADGISKPLDTEKAVYGQLTWNEEGTALAVLKGTTPKGQTHRVNSMMVFTSLDKAPVKFIYDPASDTLFPKGFVLSETGSITVSDDLNRFFFGIREQEPKAEKKPGDPPIANVDVWHWKDERLQSAQMRQATRDKAFTYLSAVVRTDSKYVRIADSTMKNASLTRDGKWAVGSDNREYLSDWKEARADYYRVNTATGERTLIVKEHKTTMGLSPDSKYYLIWKDGHFHAYNLATGAMTNISAGTTTSFVNMEYDYPGERPSYGTAGWSKDGKSLIVNGRYDLWQIPLDGKPGKNLTNGYGDTNEIRFRYLRTDSEERFIDLARPLYLSAYGQWTKKAGFSLLEKGRLTSLVFEDKHFGSPSKAKQADKFFLTIESPREYPDYHITDMKFGTRQKVTDTNPILDEFNWYSNVLIDYTNDDGVRLQGVLMVPDTYKPGDKLPMLVDFYEKNSQNFNRWSRVIYRDTPMFPKYASNGYLVLLPDIHFRTGSTHSDMLECIEAAVNKVNELGYVDMKRLGLHGHSFSGQGGNYVVTHSDMFAAAVIGAGATNLVSDFNQLWKSSGTNQHRYNHYGQGRFGKNPFDDFDLYLEQSAVYHARNMNTPLLLLHGVDDGSVEWLQAIEFYNALRFNSKNVILLSYPGEGHHLSKWENQVDFQTRMEQFYDHYLKDKKPAPEWMVKGIPFLKKAK
ncbi:MAG: prolyl oligopeptidase family serine peptidase [Bacteroidales bacterium]